MKCSLFSAGGELKRLKKRLGTKAGTNNQLNLKVMPSMKFTPRLQRQEQRLLTTASFLSPD